MAEKVTEKRALEMAATGLDCSQICFGYGAELQGFDAETAHKIGAAFGGGMFRGETCGCVTGALMAIGLKYGHLANDPDAKNEMMALVKEFSDAFEEENGSLICRNLLGYDLSKPEEMQVILEKGLMRSICPKLITSACEILDDIL